MAERQISLDGIPEPIARAIELLAESARRVSAIGSRDEENRPVELPVWKLGVKQPLRREDFYDDAH